MSLFISGRNTCTLYSPPISKKKTLTLTPDGKENMGLEKQVNSRCEKKIWTQETGINVDSHLAKVLAKWDFSYPVKRPP